VDLPLECCPCAFPKFTILQQCIGLDGASPTHLLPMLSSLSLLHMCGLGLCPFRGLVCDLLLRSRRGSSWNATHCQKSILIYNCDMHCLENTGLIWCLSYLGVWCKGFSALSCRAPEGHDQTPELFRAYLIFSPNFGLQWPRRFFHL